MGKGGGAGQSKIKRTVLSPERGEEGHEGKRNDLKCKDPNHFGATLVIKAGRRKVARATRKCKRKKVN